LAAGFAGASAAMDETAIAAHASVTAIFDRPCNFLFISLPPVMTRQLPSTRD
jgi:hypothetical protein